MTGSKGLDWAGARARLEKLQNSLAEDRDLPPEEVSRIYRERARRLAQPAESLENLQATEMLMIFRLGDERYAFRVSDTSEVVPECKLTPVPGAPPEVAGVIQVRGDIRPVYNLRRELGISNPTAGPAGPVILMQTTSRPFGVQVDVVEEIRPVAHEDRRMPGQAAHVAWITQDLVTVLNADSLWKRET